MAVNGSSQSQRPFSPPAYPPPPPTLSPGLVKIQQGRSSGKWKAPPTPPASIAETVGTTLLFFTKNRPLRQEEDVYSCFLKEKSQTGCPQVGYSVKEKLRADRTPLFQAF